MLSEKLFRQAGGDFILVRSLRISNISNFQQYSNSIEINNNSRVMIKIDQNILQVSFLFCCKLFM